MVGSMSALGLVLKHPARYQASELSFSRWEASSEHASTRSVSRLRETINKYMSDTTSGDEKYSHTDEKYNQSVAGKAATIQR